MKYKINFILLKNGKIIMQYIKMDILHVLRYIMIMLSKYFIDKYIIYIYIYLINFIVF